MNNQSLRRIHRVTALIFLAAILFFLFFQVNKFSPFVEANPFAVDPYDAVGSIAIQLALLVSLLSYARVIRWRDDPTQDKVRLVLHGNILVLAAIFVTLFSDALAEFVHPASPSLWKNILILELASMFLLTLICGLVLWLAFSGVPSAAPQPNLTPADAIDDLWCLVRVPVVRAGAIFPPAMVDWVKRFNSDRLFARVSWVNPRLHPWRFTAAVGFLVAGLLILAQLREGPLPNLALGLLLIGIFLSVELGATLLGYAIFGGYLGLRPTIMKDEDVNHTSAPQNLH